MLITRFSIGISAFVLDWLGSLFYIVAIVFTKVGRNGI